MSKKERAILISELTLSLIRTMIKVWYDKEGDYFEIMFEQKAGYFRETKNDAVMEKVDKDGNVIGFSILNVSALKDKRPLSFTLKDKAA